MPNIYEILQKIGFDWQVALANLFNFLIIFVLLKKFAFGPIKKLIKERQDKINEGLENAKKSKTELMMADIKKGEIIKDAQKQSNEISILAIKNKEEIIKNAKNKAVQEAQEIIKEANNSGSKELERMKLEFNIKSAEIIVAATEKILKEKFNEKENEKYIKKVTGLT